MQRFFQQRLLPDYFGHGFEHEHERLMAQDAGLSCPPRKSEPGVGAAAVEPGAVLRAAAAPGLRRAPPKRSAPGTGPGALRSKYRASVHRFETVGEDRGQVGRFAGRALGDAHIIDPPAVAADGGVAAGTETEQH